MCSVGADKTALLCRGDSVLDLPDGYRFMLPTLPASDSSKCTVFLHADIGARPYRIEDFREPLRELGVLKDVAGMGVFQMGHVWTVRLKTSIAKDMLMKPGKFQVKGGWCVPIDPDQREVRLKLHWVPFDTPNEALKKKLEDFGTVRDITREKWHIDGFEDVESTTRVARLLLKEGMTLDRLPHQLRVYGGAVLVVVPGRAPLCLRCRRTGHIRRDCRVPRCSKCRDYGHERQDCIQSYARAAGNRGAGDETSELVMDEDEAEEAATPSKPAPPASAPKASVSSVEAPGPSKEAERKKGVKEGTAAGAESTGNLPAGTSTDAMSPAAAKDGERILGAETTTKVATEQDARGKSNEVAQDSAMNDDMSWDVVVEKRRFDDVAATKGELALRRLERQWKVVGKKGRYEARSRSPSRTRGDRLSQ
ncbi:hypothetical protein ISCGN_019219 [Ixodes scapularis]